MKEIKKGIKKRYTTLQAGKITPASPGCQRIIPFMAFFLFDIRIFHSFLLMHRKKLKYHL